MKKIKLTAVALLLMVGYAQAQTEESKQKQQEVEVEINDNQVIISADDVSSLSQLDLNKMIREVTAQTLKIQKQQRELMAQVERLEKSGEITAEEAEEMREGINEQTEQSMEVVGEMMEVWGEAYEERMEAWAEEYEAKMEVWENEVAGREQGMALPPLPPLPPLAGMPPAPPAPESSAKADTNKRKRVIISDEGVEVVPGEEGDMPFAFRFKDKEESNEEPKSKKIDRTDGYLDVNFGFDQMITPNGLISAGTTEELNFWKSTQFALGAGWKTRLGNPYSKLYLKYGIDFSWHNFRLTDDNILQTDNNGVAFVDTISGIENVEKSKYFISYFNIPVMLQLDFSEVGETDEAFTLGVGGYAGVRMKSKREVEYSNRDFKVVEEKAYGDFDTNKWRYGVMAQVGFDSWKITASYDLNSFFNKDTSPEYNMASIAIGLTL